MDVRDRLRLKLQRCELLPLYDRQKELLYSFRQQFLRGAVLSEKQEDILDDWINTYGKQVEGP